MNSYTVSKVCAFYGLVCCVVAQIHNTNTSIATPSLSASPSLSAFLFCLIICPLKELQLCAELGDNYCLQFDFYAT